MQEFLDILDERGEKTGRIASYEEAHAAGLMHRSVHVWIANARGELLLQKRAAGKRAYPGHWDISAAGHVSAGETSLAAAKRETLEELGLAPPDDAFRFLFAVEEHVNLNAGTYIANEWQDVYLVRSDAPIAALALEEREVEQARWLSLEEFEAWIAGGGEPLVPHPEEYRRLLAVLRS